MSLMLRGGGGGGGGRCALIASCESHVYQLLAAMDENSAQAPLQASAAQHRHRSGAQEEVEEQVPMGPDALMRQKNAQKRHREGYEEGVATTHKPLPALSFITADNPVQLLGQYSRCFQPQLDSQLRIMQSGMRCTRHLP